MSGLSGFRVDGMQGLTCADFWYRSGMDAETVERAPAKQGAVKERPRSPLTGAPLPEGRKKGVPNKVTRTIREAIELASQPGQCHPRGLAGWLVERARSKSAADRQIFAGLVARVLPLQVRQEVSGGIAVQLGWLNQRGIGAHAAQSAERVPQVIDSKVARSLVNVTITQEGDEVVLRPAGLPVGDAVGEAVPVPSLEPERGA
jgi:hypothetical protein